MHSLHGSGVSVSTASTSSGGSGPSTIRKKHRYSSRSNSVSSASVVTVKRKGSLSSTSTGIRSSATPKRAQSPNETSLIALRLPREPVTYDIRRRKSVAVDSTEEASIAGLHNVDRWSQSTDSSATSDNKNRSRASSGAALPNLPNQSYPRLNKSRSIIDYSPRPSLHRQATSPPPTSHKLQSPTTSPHRDRRRPSRPELTSPLTALPPLHPTPALTDPNDTESPSTIPTLATPSTQSSYGQDYFGDDGVSLRNTTKSKKPVTVGNHMASMSGGTSSRTPAVGGAHDTRNAPMSTKDHVQQDDQRSAAQLNSRYSEKQPENDRPSTASTSSHHKRSRTHEKGERDKKAMLSKALQKANTAVLLDNAQNFEGALDAYRDACRLLQQVMDRSSGVENKRKLDAIRLTYTTRVEELLVQEAAQPEAIEGKKLPARPMSDDSIPLSPVSASSPTIDTHMKNSPNAENASTTSTADAPRISYHKKDRDSFFSGTMRAVAESSLQESKAVALPGTPETTSFESSTDDGSEIQSPVMISQATPVVLREASIDLQKAVQIPPLKANGVYLPPPEADYMPAPLSPRRPLSPNLREEAEDPSQAKLEVVKDEQTEVLSGHESTTAPLSWLGTIDEDGSSCSSSVHSISSEQGFRRKHIRGASGDTHADFDAAFDAAVEAAYNEGFEPDLEGRRTHEPASTTHGPQESINVRASAIKEILSPTSYHPAKDSFNLGTDDEEEEEERLLDEITQDYAQNFNFDLNSKSALPRQSDSSGYSRSTWQSSQVSDRTTAGTSLSTVAEDTLPAPLSKNAFATASSINTMLAEPTPPPQTSLPKPPGASQNRMSGVRSRRLSGQHMKQLKIETSAKADPSKRASTLHNSASPFAEENEHEGDLDKNFKFGAELLPSASTASDQQHELILTSPPSLDMLSTASDVSRPMTATTVTTEQRKSIDESASEFSTHKPPLFRKNMSSASLREHTFILPSPTVGGRTPAIATPMSSSYMTFASRRNNEAPLSSQRANLPSFGASMPDGPFSGGADLFDTSLSMAQVAASPRSPVFPNQAVGLEPCTESFLLRPFWLMRAIASTLMHPKGGFLTTRLFVPREVWQTRGVKLKSVEDKVANCDLLTAALGRLAGVDTYDADAVMEELQNFEEVMERVQNNLVKKLGSDVGVGGLAGVFKDASGGATSAASNAPGSDTASIMAEKTRSKEGKGYLNSWRKLRSKSSGTPITGHQSNRAMHKPAEKELSTMQSVPMTSHVPVERRGQKRDAKSLTFEGPNREYMGSLARLFEGVQVLDQIARQVEDPGLKGSSPTHVGLELSIRHAAEFFGFYICRFVLADLGTLIDKFVKRGTEWVLA
ncbi:hypothetical protein LTR37_009953 [Vermiconidia calcicola]|uniref:Uncharacterized protein n=1 Tax=Vermiconidia calcicola TaxID=1690605 RepID=A0ACC3N6S7_9PEZI|nr:hypothetical protein LTR37_009953 [Vermiconidia calcicola]